METESKEIIKEKIYEDGRKNYATKGEALGVGIPALSLAGIAVANMLFGKGRGLNVGGNSMPENVAIAMGGNCLGGSMTGMAVPTPFQIWNKETDDVFALNNRIYGAEISGIKEIASLRERDQEDKFALYKSQRDSYDALKAEIDAVKQSVAITAAVRPYQDRLLQSEIEKAYSAGISYVDTRTARMLNGELVLPNTPTVTGFASYTPCVCSQLSAPSVPASTK